MTVDIARSNGNALGVLETTNEALARLAGWVEAARNAHQLVGPLVDTAFIPDAYKPKVDPRATPEQKAEARQVAIANGTAAVLQGITLGLDPMTALQQIYVVHGRPGMYTEIKVALLKSRGHEVWTEDLTDTRAVVCGRRKGTDYVERVTVTMDQARKAGWTSNAAYSKTPQDMLYARAAARVCDRVAPDVLMGIASVEEIQDEVRATAEVGQRTVTPRRRAAAAAIEASTVDDPPIEEEPWPTKPTPAEPTANQPTPDGPTSTSPTPAASETPQPKLVTAAQQKKMHALLNETGRKDRDIAMVYIAGVIGREIESTKELTVVEAGQVIEAMEGEILEPALDGDGWPPVAGEAG